MVQTDSNPSPESAAPNPGYTYTCLEKSVLYPPLRKHLWAPAVPLLPASLSPNTMTLVGNGLAWAAFGMLLVLDPRQRLLFVVPALLNFLYLSLDNMDGIQARRVGRCSPLGEYLDHWFDAFIATMMVLGFGIATRLEPWIMLLAMAMISATYFATFWEQHLARRVVFGRFGSIEAIVAISLFYLAIALFGLEPVARTPRLAGFSLTSLCFALVGLVSGCSVLAAMFRVGYRWGDFLPHVVVYGAGGLWFALGQVPALAMGFLFMLAGAHLGGRLVMARVLEEKPRIGDPLLYGLILSAAVLSLGLDLGPRAQGLAALVPIAYLAARLLADFNRTVGTLRSHLAPGELLAHLLPRL